MAIGLFIKLPNGALFKTNLTLVKAEMSPAGGGCRDQPEIWGKDKMRILNINILIGGDKIVITAIRWRHPW